MGGPVSTDTAYGNHVHARPGQANFTDFTFHRFLNIARICSKSRFLASNMQRYVATFTFKLGIDTRIEGAYVLASMKSKLIEGDTVSMRLHTRATALHALVWV